LGDPRFSIVEVLDYTPSNDTTIFDKLPCIVFTPITPTSRGAAIYDQFEILPGFIIGQFYYEIDPANDRDSAIAIQDLLWYTLEYVNKNVQSLWMTVSGGKVLTHSVENISLKAKDTGRLARWAIIFIGYDYLL